MKAVENDFAKQTHGRLSVAQAKKKKKPKGTRDEFRSHSVSHPGRRTAERRKRQMPNRTGQGSAVTGAEMVCVCFLTTNVIQIYTRRLEKLRKIKRKHNHPQCHSPWKTIIKILAKPFSTLFLCAYKNMSLQNGAHIINEILYVTFPPSSYYFEYFPMLSYIP